MEPYVHCNEFFVMFSITPGAEKSTPTFYIDLTLLTFFSYYMKYAMIPAGKTGRSAGRETDIGIFM